MKERVEELEVKVAYLEHGLQELDSVVREAIDSMQGIHRELRELRTELAATTVRGNPAEERPPHHLPDPD